MSNSGGAPAGNDVAGRVEDDRRALHQTACGGIERLAAMHREAVVPQQQIADLPSVRVDVLGRVAAR